MTNKSLASQSVHTVKEPRAIQSVGASPQRPVQKQFLASFPLRRGTRIDHRRYSNTQIIPTPRIILGGKHALLSEKLQEKWNQKEEDDAPPQMNHGHRRQVADVSLYKELKARLKDCGLTEDDCRCETFRRVTDATPRRPPAPHWKLSMERLTGDAWDWSEGDGVCVEWCVFEWGVRMMSWKEDWEVVLEDLLGESLR